MNNDEKTIKELKMKIERTEYVLKTVILWMGREFGEQGCKQLMAIMEEDNASEHRKGE